MTNLPESLRLLASLRQLDEQGFAELLRARHVPARGMHDPIDLAEWLNRDEHVRAAVTRLTWPMLLGLRRGESWARERAAALQLAVREGDRIELFPSAAATLRQLLPAVPRFEAAESSAALDAERAHEAAQLANDALWLVDARPPAVQHSRAGVRCSMAEVRRLATELHRPVELVSTLLSWLAQAELIAPADDVWAPTAAGRAFVQQSMPQRWRVLALAWREQLTAEEVRDRAWRVRDVTAPVHPAISLGLADAVRGELTDLGVRVLNGELDAATELLRERMSAPVTGVYVQPDLTIIAPGPLSGADDAELRTMAELEQRGTASQYRLTPASVERALLAGLGRDQVRARLERLSLTGIPQPVAYLLDAAAERFGQVRVRSYVDDFGRITTRVRSLAPNLLDTMRVDKALGALTLRLAEDELASPAAPETVLGALRAARYPAVLENRAGKILPCQVPMTAAPWQPPYSNSLRQAAAALAAKVASAPAADDQVTWLRRRLELARRDRTELRLEIAMGAGRTASLDVIPLAVTERRLRARDTDAEVERTVPLRAIVAVEGTSVPRGTDAN